MSKYVNKMRDALLSFNRQAVQIGMNMSDSRKRYSDGYAATEIDKLHGQLNRAAVAAKNQIDGILLDAQAAAKKWAELDGAEVNTADLGLLNGGFVLSVEDITAMVSKYWDNGTMINAISKYVRQQHMAVCVPNLDDKLQAYKILGQSAHQMIASIAEGVGMDEAQISSWGVSGNVSYRLERALYGI